MRNEPNRGKQHPTKLSDADEARIRPLVLFLDAQDQVFKCLRQLENAQKGNELAWILTNAVINLGWFVTLTSIRDSTNEAALVGVIAAVTYVFQLIESGDLVDWSLQKNNSQEISNFYHALRTYCRVILMNAHRSESTNIAYTIEHHLRRQPLQYSKQFWHDLSRSPQPLRLILLEYYLITRSSV